MTSSVKNWYIIFLFCNSWTCEMPSGDKNVLIFLKFRFFAFKVFQKGWLGGTPPWDPPPGRLWGTTGGCAPDHTTTRNRSGGEKARSGSGGEKTRSGSEGENENENERPLSHADRSADFISLSLSLYMYIYMYIYIYVERERERCVLTCMPIEAHAQIQNLFL